MLVSPPNSKLLLKQLETLHKIDSKRNLLLDKVIDISDLNGTLKDLPTVRIRFSIGTQKASTEISKSNLDYKENKERYLISVLAKKDLPSVGKDFSFYYHQQGGRSDFGFFEVKGDAIVLVEQREQMIFVKTNQNEICYVLNILDEAN